jgi:cytochrome c556
MLRTLTIIALGLGLSAAAVQAQQAGNAEDPIAKRRMLMRANGAAAGLGGAMVKGEVPFSPAAANSVLSNFRAVGYTFGDYFPEGSQTGDTRALPRIWEDMAGFQAELADFRADAEAAIAAKPETLEAFQAAFATLGQDCQSCHEKYRRPQD